MPLYDVSAVAHALEITPKQLDNILSRHDLAGVERKRRGVTRRIGPEAAVIINLAWQLAQAAKIPIAAALGLARQLSTEPTLAIGEFLTLSVSYSAIRANTLERLNGAVEAVGRRRRGRPPRSAARTATEER